MCRSRRELSNEYLLAKIGVDTAENEPLEVWGKNSIQYSLHSLIIRSTPYPLNTKSITSRRRQRHRLQLKVSWNYMLRLNEAAASEIACPMCRGLSGSCSTPSGRAAGSDAPCHFHLGPHTHSLLFLRLRKARPRKKANIFR